MRRGILPQVMPKCPSDVGVQDASREQGDRIPHAVAPKLLVFGSRRYVGSYTPGTRQSSDASDGR